LAYHLLIVSFANKTSASKFYLCSGTAFGPNGSRSTTSSQSRPRGTAPSSSSSSGGICRTSIAPGKMKIWKSRISR